MRCDLTDIRDAGLINEDEVLQKVSHYITDLGFSLHQVRFEHKTITIKSFRNVEIKVGKEQKTQAFGRIDVLVLNDNADPLFVVEVKEPNVDLLEGKEQAISYARLLLSPLAVVTNGRDTKLFDPLTQNGEEIQSATSSKYLKSGMKVEVSEDIRYEAFQNFIGYSADNLMSFCELQRNNRMNFLKGENDTMKKYIPQIFVPPPLLKERFEEFLLSDKKVFLVSGESVSGKTNAVCYLSDTIGARYPCLFYAATVLSREESEVVEDDFNYHFSQEKSFISLLKRIRNILEKQDTKLILFLDAIDEYQRGNVSITDLFDQIKDSDVIKLCVSAKNTRKNDFLFVNDIPTLATSYVEYICEKFKDSQLEAMLAKYASFFLTGGQIIGEVREQCRQPFLQESCMRCSLILKYHMMLRRKN